MTRDDILRMAREAGFVMEGDLRGAGRLPELLKRFAALVAAAERDQMLSEGWRQCAQGQRTTQHCAVAEQDRLEEREACARVCEALHVVTPTTGCAAAIRARGMQDPKVTHLNEWARDRLARHGIQIPEDEDGNPSF